MGNVYRIVFLFLLFCLLLLFGGTVFSQVPAIKLDVVPKVALENPYKTQTFRVRVTIPNHEDNRLFSYSGECGAELKSFTREIPAYTMTWFEDFHVTDDCYFQVCLHRKVAGKVKNICVDQEVRVGKEEDP